MKSLLPLVFILAILSLEYNIHAQFYFTGEPPASVKWNQIETGNFKVVYPEEMYQSANRFANYLEHYKIITEESLNHYARPLPILMHGSSVISNGYVAWAPKRMEIVASPPQDSYAQDWLAQLALHEYRHVVQIDKLNKGFTRGLSLLTGQIATGISSAMIPRWLYEGDAVLSETRFSSSGRGRIPGFEMPLRTIVLENTKQFTYDKAVFGSFKDYVPDHYQYGYQIVSYAQERFGDTIWIGAIDFTAKHPFLISPLALYLKKHFGRYKSGLYQMTMDSLKYMYNKQKDTHTYTGYSTITTRGNEVYTNYILPRFIDDHSIIALRTSIDHLDRLIVIDSTGRESKILTTGISRRIGLSATSRYIVWDELIRDPRWPIKDYSEIRILDLTNGKVRSLFKRTRFFSPDITKDETYIVAVETDDLNRQYIVVVDVVSNEVIKRIPASDNHAFQTPRWNKEGNIIVIVVTDEGKAVEELNPETEIRTTLVPATWYNIAEPLCYNDYVIFRSSFNGLENLFAVNRNTKSIYQITSARYGAFHPEVSPDESRIIYSDYTLKGFDIVEIPLDTNSWKLISADKQPTGIWSNAGMAMEESVYTGLHDRQMIEYESEPYRKIFRLFKLHSWMPFYTSLPDDLNIQDFQVSPGFMLFSQNLLSNFISTIGYRYTNKGHLIKPVARWKGRYPVFEFSGNFTIGNQEPAVIEDPEFNTQHTEYKSFDIKAYVPLVFTRGKFIRQIQPQIGFQHTNTYYIEEDNVKNGLDLFHFRLQLSYYLRLSVRDLYPRMGQFLTLDYTHTPLNSNQFGDLFSMNTVLYLPGLGAHHHLFFIAGMQKQMIKEYYLPINRIRYPRGYPAALSKFLGSLAVNYAFPVLYPDWSIESILYLKRIKANLFWDYSYGRDIVEKHQNEHIQFSGSYYSFGTEISADIHPFRFIFPLSTGIRIGYLPLKKKVFTDFLISISTAL